MRSLQRQLILNLGFLLSLLLFITTPHSIVAQPDNFLVIFVEGAINVKLQNGDIEKLISGRSYKGGAIIEFKSPSKAIVIDSKKGRLLLTNVGKNNKAKSSISNMLKDLLTIIPSPQKLSTMGKSKMVSDLKPYFGNSDFYIQGSELEIRLDTYNYRINKGSYFEIIFPYQEDTIRKMLPISKNKDAIILNQDSIFRDQEYNQIPKTDFLPVTIHYYTPKLTKPIKSYEFNLHFLEEPQIKMMYDLLLQKVKKEIPRNTEDRYKYLISFFKNSLGKIDEFLLQEWLIQNEY